MTLFFFRVFYKWYLDGLYDLHVQSSSWDILCAGQIVSPWVTWWHSKKDSIFLRCGGNKAVPLWTVTNNTDITNLETPWDITIRIAWAFTPGYFFKNRKHSQHNDYLVSMKTTNMCMITLLVSKLHILIMIIDLSHETYESTFSKLIGSSTHWVHFALGLGLRWTSCLYADVDQPCTTKDAGTTNKRLFNWDPREVQGLLLHGMH